jgi:hypothetical protein
MQRSHAGQLWVEGKGGKGKEGSDPKNSNQPPFRVFRGPFPSALDIHAMVAVDKQD